MKKGWEQAWKHPPKRTRAVDLAAVLFILFFRSKRVFRLVFDVVCINLLSK